LDLLNRVDGAELEELASALGVLFDRRSSARFLLAEFNAKNLDTTAMSFISTTLPFDMADDHTSQIRTLTRRLKTVSGIRDGHLSKQRQAVVQALRASIKEMSAR
jgi:hypothetical protein